MYVLNLNWMINDKSLQTKNDSERRCVARIYDYLPKYI